MKTANDFLRILKSGSTSLREDADWKNNTLSLRFDLRLLRKMPIALSKFTEKHLDKTTSLLPNEMRGRVHMDDSRVTSGILNLRKFAGLRIKALRGL